MNTDLNIPFEEIARTKFKIDNSNNEIIVILGKPQKLENKKSFYCPFNLQSPYGDVKRWAPGVDSFKALQSALWMINSELRTISRLKSITITRTGHKEGDLGFIEWDLVSLRNFQTKLEVDKNLKSEERKKLEDSIKELLKKEKIWIDSLQRK